MIRIIFPSLFSREMIFHFKSMLFKRVFTGSTFEAHQKSGIINRFVLKINCQEYIYVSGIIRPLSR